MSDYHLFRTFTAQKMKFPAGLVTFTGEILNGKLHLLSSVCVDKGFLETIMELIKNNYCNRDNIIHSIAFIHSFIHSIESVPISFRMSQWGCLIWLKLSWNKPLFLKGIPEFLDSGRKSWTLDPGRWALDVGLWMLDSGRCTLDAGLWTLDSKPWTLNSRCWTPDIER